MASSKLSAQDSKELDKYIRYMVYKSVQIIVQARQGERLNVPTKQFATGVDWFNLTVRDNADVLAEVKRVYPAAGGGGLCSGDAVCVETVLSATNGDSIPLEVWCLRLVPPVDVSARISFTVYSRIGMLLKALMVVTRAVPAYRIARRCTDAPSNRSVCYRVYIGEPSFTPGVSTRTQLVGLVPTPIGTVSLNVIYRTDVSFSPHHQESGRLDVREDHFCVDQKVSVASGYCHLPCRHATSCHSEDSDRMSVHSIPMLSPATPESKKTIVPDSVDSHPNSPVEPTCPVEHSNEEMKPNCAELTALACKQSSPLPHDQLMPSSDSLKDCDKVVPPGGKTDPTNLLSEDTATGTKSKLPAAPSDDFVLLDGCNTHGVQGNREMKEDLDKFYKECRAAPELSMFHQPPCTVRELLQSITEQLVEFEANAKEFDEFINSLTSPES